MVADQWTRGQRLLPTDGQYFVGFGHTVSGFPPLAASTSNNTLSFSTLPLTTFVLSLNLKPCLVSSFWNCLAISASIPAPIAGKNSTTVTSAPSLLQTEP